MVHTRYRPDKEGLRKTAGVVSGGSIRQASKTSRRKKTRTSPNEKKKRRSPNKGRDGETMLTTVRGNKKKLRGAISGAKKMFKKTGHWKDPDPYRFMLEMIKQFSKGCKKVEKLEDGHDLSLLK